MTAEDRLRDAYRDLTDRVARDIDPALGFADRATPPPDPRDRRPIISRRPALALAAAAVVAAGVTAIALNRGGDGQEIDTGPATSVPADVTGSTVDGTSPTSGPTTGDTSPEGSSPDGVATGTRYRVDIERVRADAADPFLNVRLTPDPGGQLLAKLPATYTGLRATGRTEVAADGGTWLEVELLDPVAVSTVVRDTGRPPAGWANAAFLVELPGDLPVTTEEVPACAGGFDPIDTGSGLATGYLYAMDSGIVEPGCLRVVLTFGAGPAPFEWYDLPDGTGPAAGLPEVIDTMSGGLGASFDLGVVDGAWPRATDTADQVYAVRRDDRSIDLVTPLPVDGVTVTGLPERGIAVIDLELGRGQAPPSGAGVALTEPILTGAGSADVVGLARPFEATLGVTIEDGSGRPVEAVYSGSDFLGTRRASEYGVGTTDWVEAWGMFAVRAEGLAAGDYTLVLDAGGGADDPETLRVPFTVDEAGDEPELTTDAEQAAARALVDFARGGDAGAVPLADEVTLYLGAEPFRTASRATLADRDAWVTDPPDGYAGFSGPFSALDGLQRLGLRYTAGPIGLCAGPAVDWPAELEGFRQVNVEPVGISSCIQWFGVHVFLDGDDRIAAVALALFGP